MHVSRELLAKNRAWAARMCETQPDFFLRLSQQQAPKYLWIGCSDSRVPANELLGLLPGELFVHRNVANVVVHSDLNCLSVLQYAVEVLRVEHIIVCGHYGCGGVEAALRGEHLGLIDNWLQHVQDVHQIHRREMDSIGEFRRKADRLCELNVIEQVVNVAQTTIVRDAWERGQPLSLRGWIYGLHDGLLRELGLCTRSLDELLGSYQQAISSAQDAPATEPPPPPPLRPDTCEPCSSTPSISG
jgi:carbonic anhydrase